MPWWNKLSDIPTNNTNFHEIVSAMVFNCPSCHEYKRTNAPNRPHKEYEAVSRRACTFRERNINHSLLRTILSKMTHSMRANATYEVLKPGDSIEEHIKQIIRSSSLQDPNFEVMAFHKHSNMSDTEAIFYYIRNAFAHGSFEIRHTTTGTIYLLESAKGTTIKAQMRLKESTLIEFIRLAQLLPEDIKGLQRHRH